MKTIEARAVDTIRTLAMDAVEQANAGHPGTAMALAPVAYVLYRDVMRIDPTDPSWPGRDRFVLSAGHACMLQYAALHLTGFDLTIDDLRAFRQWGSRTPGHPELHHTPGVETTTGPLGQGIATAVGMALAERMLAARFNRDGHDVIDHRTFVIASDGDLQEGIAHEAAAFAGHLGLDRLCVIWDDNHITIEGDTSLSMSEDVVARFAAYGFHVARLDDDFTLASVRAAIDEAVASGRPSLIALRTHIAQGAPHAQDTHEAHGAPLGPDEVRATKIAYGVDPDATFAVDADVAEHCDRRAAGAALADAWRQRMDAYRAAHPELADQLDRQLRGDLPGDVAAALPSFPLDKPIATRAASGAVINALATALPELVGGSADLAGSNNTTIADGGSVARDAYGGRVLHFGIREHGMGAILNGINVHGGLRAFGGTFLVFSDYMRGAVRLAALMGVPSIFVWTHDSVWLGEDGPTHQPIEHLMALRAIPNLVVVRPADATETAEAWRVAVERRDGPTGIVLTRQALPVLDRSTLAPASGVARGGYVLADADGTPDAIVIATGSEVHDALAARAILAADGVATRVVSMPSMDLFEAQDRAYRDAILPPSVTTRVSIEAGTTFGWAGLVGPAGRAIGIDRFGASAPGKTVARELGISAEAVVAAVTELRHAR